MKDLLQQIAQLWKQLGANQRVSIVLTAAAVVAGMVALVLWSGRPQMQLLYGRLSEKDAAEVVAAVQAAGVAYELAAGGTAVRVEAGAVHKLRMQLAAKGVPSGEGVGFEIFDRTNFGISDFVQRTNFARALQGELSRTISQLQGVSSARVLIVQPENRLLFSDEKAKPTASVFIEGNISPESVNSIRFLVTNAVEGLRADDVAVVDHRGNVLTEGLKDDPQLGAASGQMKLRKSVEDYFSQKVETMLATVLGPGSAVVRVSAEIETESTTRSEERYDPDGQVVRNETSTEDSTTTTEQEEKTPAVGASANLPNQPRTDASAAGGKSSQQVRKNKTNSYEINRVTLNAVKAPGGIARVTAAVFVASKEQPRSPAELDALRRMVANALGIAAAKDADLASVITLEETSFKSAEPARPGALDLAANHVDLIQQGVAVLVGLGLILVFLRLLKRTRPDQIPVELLDAARSSQVSRASGANAGAASGITPEMLNAMIQQKPGNIGAALRDWMGTGTGAGVGAGAGVGSGRN